MLLLPIAFDQAGVAARVLHAQAGLRLLPALASTRAITRALRRLLDEPTFAAEAEALGQQVPAGDAGTRRAADLIEAMARTAPGGADGCVAQAIAGIRPSAAAHG